jgi:hypothetical protein
LGEAIISFPATKNLKLWEGYSKEGLKSLLQTATKNLKLWEGYSKEGLKSLLQTGVRLLANILNKKVKSFPLQLLNFSVSTVILAKFIKGLSTLLDS